jgi:hypothetical protein
MTFCGFAERRGEGAVASKEMDRDRLPEVCLPASVWALLLLTSRLFGFHPFPFILLNSVFFSRPLILDVIFIPSLSSSPHCIHTRHSKLNGYQASLVTPPHNTLHAVICVNNRLPVSDAMSSGLRILRLSLFSCRTYFTGNYRCSVI